MQITFDTRNPQDLQILEQLFKNIDGLLQPEQPHKGMSDHIAQATKGFVRIDPVTGNVGIGTPKHSAQPAVASNTGTDGSGFTLSPEASGVSEQGAAQAAPAAPETAPQDLEKKRGRPAKAKEEVAAEVAKNPAPEPASEPEPAPAPAADVVHTLDTVRAALQQFTAAKGVPAGIELLKKFGAGRISELDESDYAEFVAECNV